ncbi:hypothetical protein HDV05_002021, partial [Chytridiales sp. JEL 0842]
AGLILLNLPYQAARVLHEASINWTRLFSLSSESTPTSPLLPREGFKAHHHTVIEKPEALFNLTQLHFLAQSRQSATTQPTAADEHAFRFFSRILSQFIHPTNPRLSDPSTLLITSLQKSLELFNGSADTPSSSTSDHRLTLHLPITTSNNKRLSIFEKNTSQALPKTPKPKGAPTNASTRVCLALCRSFVALFERSDERQKGSLIEEAKGWVSKEAAVCLSVAASAASTSSSTKPTTDILSNSMAANNIRDLKDWRRKSTVVSGAGLQGVLIAAVAAPGEVHAPLAVEVGCLSSDLELWERHGYETPHQRMQDEGEGTVQRLVKLCAKRVKEEVVGVIRLEEMKLIVGLEKL